MVEGYKNEDFSQNFQLVGLVKIQTEHDYFVYSTYRPKKHDF